MEDSARNFYRIPHELSTPSYFNWCTQIGVLDFQQTLLQPSDMYTYYDMLYSSMVPGNLPSQLEVLSTGQNYYYETIHNIMWLYLQTQLSFLLIMHLAVNLETLESAA